MRWDVIGTTVLGGLGNWVYEDEDENDDWI